MKPYLNVEEVESALVGLEKKYPTLCERIKLPNATFEKRTCHVLRIGKKAGAGTREGILFLGSVHASEWGGADICVSFAADLVEAAATGTGLAYGGKSFTSAELKDITTSLDVYVFPCVNPDGRRYSMVNPPSTEWRKNRNPASSGGDPKGIGVDINRNYDFLWDFATKMHPDAAVASAIPMNPYFHGTAPASEPETTNVVWMLDTHPNIRWLMDIHCHKGLVLYSWGDDDDQTDEPDMNFLNPAWDGKRGAMVGPYDEYIPAADLADAQEAAELFADALAAVRGTVYPVESGFDLYPTSGSGDDYSYSRHFVDATKSKVLAFTLEYGLASRKNENMFYPEPDVMQEIIREVNAGMLALCLRARPVRFWRIFLTMPWWLWRIIVLGKRPRKGDIRPHGPLPRVVRALLAVAIPYAMFRVGKKVAASLSSLVRRLVGR